MMTYIVKKSHLTMISNRVFIVLILQISAYFVNNLK